MSLVDSPSGSFVCDVYENTTHECVSWEFIPASNALLTVQDANQISSAIVGVIIFAWCWRELGRFINY